MLRWSWGSLSPSNGSSWANRNFDGIGHSRTAIVKGEFVVLTILSRLQSVFSLIAFLSLSNSFLTSWKRSEFCSFGVVSYLPHPPGWLWTDSPLVKAVASFPDFVWWALRWWPQEPGLAELRLLNLDWTPSKCKCWLETYAFEPKYKNVVPTDGAKLMKYKFVSRSKYVQMEPNPWLWKWWSSSLKMVTGVVLATMSLMPKSV